MSLDDKFYSEDENLITKFDNFMIKSIGHLGEMYQNHSGLTHKELVKKMYGNAVIGFGIGFTNPILALYSLASVGGIRNPRIETPIEEEIRFENRKIEKTRGKVNRAFHLMMPIIIIPAAVSLEYFFQVEDNDIIMQTIYKTQIIGTLGFIPFSLANYLSKANIPKPPKKTAKKELKKRFGILVPN